MFLKFELAREELSTETTIRPNRSSVPTKASVARLRDVPDAMEPYPGPRPPGVNPEDAWPVLDDGS